MVSPVHLGMSCNAPAWSSQPHPGVMLPGVKQSPSCQQPQLALLAAGWMHSPLRTVDKAKQRNQRAKRAKPHHGWMLPRSANPVGVWRSRAHAVHTTWRL